MKLAKAVPIVAVSSFILAFLICVSLSQLTNNVNMTYQRRFNDIEVKMLHR